MLWSLPFPRSEFDVDAFIAEARQAAPLRSLQTDLETQVRVCVCRDSGGVLTVMMSSEGIWLASLGSELGRVENGRVEI